METNPLRKTLALFATKTSSRTEADVQMNIAAFLTLADVGLSETQVTKTEDQLSDGTRRRIDISYGRLVIEVKRDLDQGRVLENTVPQLRGYLKVRQQQEGTQYAGVITDGVDWHLYGLMEDSELSLIDSHRVQPEDSTASERLGLWLQTILLTGEKIRVTPRTIEERLGTFSPRFKLDRARLEAVYKNHPKPNEVATKRHLWARLLRTALGTGFDDSVDLFLDHTLLVVEAELIAHLVIGENPNNYSPSEIVSGEVFRRAGIFNVVAQDFFDWVADSDDGREFVQSLTRELQQFDWTHLEHDVLKVLYEAIIDKQVRKSLGEYYTPDWLAEKVIDGVEFNSLEQRAMDPACGSGTFVFHLIKKFIREAEASGITGPDLIDLLQDRVWGLDIHPVSVVLARVTYLLAIGADRLANRHTLTVPVYLGDSIQWTRGANLLSGGNLSIDVESEDLASDLNESLPTLFTSEDTLVFPLSVLSDPTKFDRLVSAMSDLAQTYTDLSQQTPKISSILSRFEVESGADTEVLTNTFQTLCRLNAEGRNHIWGYFVRNQLRPVWFSLPENRVDVLVGNPPWVAFRYMTEKMQKSFKILSQNRNLWSGGNVSTHQDLVGLFIARTVEQFLKLNGSFGFVVPFAVLSRIQYEGFRTGKWSDDAPDGVEGQTQRVRVAFSKPWDLSAVKPPIFPVPSAVVFGTKTGKEIPLSQETLRFEGKVGTLESKRSTSSQLTSDNTNSSPYAALAVQGAILTPRVLMIVNQIESRNTLGAPLGQVNVASQRSGLEKEPWKSIPSLSGYVDRDQVFPVLTGSSIAPFRKLSEWLAVLPIVENRIVSSGDLDSAFPASGDWWHHVEQIWVDKRGKSKLSMIDNIDFQSKLTRQLPLREKKVVYTTSGSNLCATYLATGSQIIDTGLYWIPIDTDQEGLYLASVLNSNTVRDRVRGLQSRGLFGPRHFHTLPLSLPIPKFDPSDNKHLTLARLGESATKLAETVEVKDPESFVAARKIVQRALDGTHQAAIDAACTVLLEP
jgi:hypothetical protein